MKVCFWEDEPGTISPGALFPLSLLSSADAFLGFFSMGALLCGPFFGFFLSNLPTERRASPSRMDVEFRGITLSESSLPELSRRCISWGWVMLWTDWD